MIRKPTYKRDALVNVAKNLIYNQGFNITTLADIANEADVPLGNLYYYFKTKVDIGLAVLNLIALEQKTFLEHLNKEPFPKVRLQFFLEQAKQESKLIALQGCYIGTLCQEFSKEGAILHNFAAKIMMDLLLWLEAQFLALGFKIEASDLSLNLIYRLQGAFLLGYAFKDATLITRGIVSLQNFVKERIAENVNALQESAA